MKQYHTIEIFSANCPLCRHIIDDIQIGKCQGCNQTVYDVNNLTDDIKRKMKGYGVTSVPTTIIDGSIKVVGIRLSLDMWRRALSKAEKRISIRQED